MWELLWLLAVTPNRVRLAKWDRQKKITSYVTRVGRITFKPQTNAQIWRKVMVYSLKWIFIYPCHCHFTRVLPFYFLIYNYSIRSHYREGVVNIYNLGLQCFSFPRGGPALGKRQWLVLHLQRGDRTSLQMFCLHFTTLRRNYREAVHCGNTERLMFYAWHLI